MPACKQVHGVRVIARPAAIDALVERIVGDAWRFAADDVFVPHATSNDVDVDDPHAIVVDEAGFSMMTFDRITFDTTIAPTIDWRLPAVGLAQGLVAAVPAKVMLRPDVVEILVATPFAHDLAERLS